MADARQNREATLAARLARLVERAERQGPDELGEDELEDLPRLYRWASTQLARLRTTRHDPAALAKLQDLVHRSHGVLHREPAPTPAQLARRLYEFFVFDCPAAIRAEWKLLAITFSAFYLLAACAYFAVSRDLELAFSLYNADAIANQIEQLRATEQGEPFRGNFTFGLDRSGQVSGFILAHNIFVSVLFFGTGLVPPLFAWVLSQNALMLGTYTAVAGHWGQAGAISSILWCHGTIELQMIVLAGSGGLVLIRAVIAPGRYTRGYALSLAARRALHLVAPVFPFLTLSGLIEGYISPHAPHGVRMAVAAASAVLLITWVGLGRRRGSTPEPAPAPVPR